MAADPAYSPGPDEVGKPVIAFNGPEQMTFMAQNQVHQGLGYPDPNIRMHAYGDIASIPRANNRTQSPFHAFGDRGRVFDAAAGDVNSAAPAGPAAPAVSAGLPVFAAASPSAAAESPAAANLSEDDPAAGGSAASDAPLVPAAASSAPGSEESAGAAAAVGETGKRKREGDQESSAKGSEERGGAAAAVAETGVRKPRGSREQRALRR